MRQIYKDRSTRALAGFFLVVVFFAQKMTGWDLSFLYFLVGANLFQYGFTGWCPVLYLLIRVGWYRDDPEKSV